MLLLALMSNDDDQWYYGDSQHSASPWSQHKEERIPQQRKIALA